MGDDANRTMCDYSQEPEYIQRCRRYAWAIRKCCGELVHGCGFDPPRPCLPCLSERDHEGPHDPRIPSVPDDWMPKCHDCGSDCMPRIRVLIERGEREDRVEWKCQRCPWFIIENDELTELLRPLGLFG